MLRNRVGRFQFMMRRSGGLSRRTAIAGDRLSGEQPVSIPFDGRLNQRGRLGQDDIGLGLWSYRSRRPGSGLTAVFGKRLARKGKRNRRTLVRNLGFVSWLEGPRSFDPGRSTLFLVCLLPAPALSRTRTRTRTKALAAATPSTPLPGAVLKLSLGRLAPSRGSVAPWSRFSFWICRLSRPRWPVLGLTWLG